MIYVLDREETGHDKFNINPIILILYSKPPHLYLKSQRKAGVRTLIALFRV